MKKSIGLLGAVIAMTGVEIFGRGKGASSDATPKKLATYKSTKPCKSHSYIQHRDGKWICIECRKELK